LRIPIVDIFLKSSIRRPEIILKPATKVIRTNIKRTLVSIRSNHENNCGKRLIEDEATGADSSSAVLRSILVPISSVLDFIIASFLYFPSRIISSADISFSLQPLIL
jgi:hypothetical protein